VWAEFVDSQYHWRYFVNKIMTFFVSIIFRPPLSNCQLFKSDFAPCSWCFWSGANICGSSVWNFRRVKLSSCETFVVPSFWRLGFWRASRFLGNLCTNAVNCVHIFKITAFLGAWTKVIVQGDQKVPVHLMITIQKVTSNVPPPVSRHL
jgi:hypothetical protein